MPNIDWEKPLYIEGESELVKAEYGWEITDGVRTYPHLVKLIDKSGLVGIETFTNEGNSGLHSNGEIQLTNTPPEPLIDPKRPVRLKGNHSVIGDVIHHRPDAKGYSLVVVFRDLDSDGDVRARVYLANGRFAPEEPTNLDIENIPEEEEEEQEEQRYWVTVYDDNKLLSTGIVHASRDKAIWAAKQDKRNLFARLSFRKGDGLEE